MLKRSERVNKAVGGSQPPSGGCVLKRCVNYSKAKQKVPAAFRRLCVETENIDSKISTSDPAAFRRLCVETL